MKSFYGSECEKHPEWAGRRYLPSGCCIGCQRQLNREGNARRRQQLLELIAAASEVKAYSGRLEAALVPYA